MKRLFLVSIMLIFSIGVWAQTITLSFTGQDAANHHVQLERVIITNLSQNWQETLYWPDTTLTLNNGVGINDNEDPVGFKLYQNNPNPFNGITDASLTVVDAGSVALEITDVNGRAVENRNFASLPAGTHHFRVSLSTAGTYIMTARQNGKTSSIKMINNGGGGENSITQLEHVAGEIIAKSGNGTKSNVTHPWAYGDNLVILGYATICGTECSKQFQRQLLYNETITIYFPESITTPSVAASSVSNITSNSASMSSSVSGNCGVTSRGFCYGTSSSPTISGQHTTNGSGTGNFTGTLSGLTPGTTYYVRAYATNAAGTAYGSQTSFTAPAPPTVTTNNVSNITTNTATGGGNVTSQGTAPVTSRGVCWSTSHNPTIADSHTTDGSGMGSFVSNLMGLSVGVTYYVRAYASNSVGVSYGNEVNFFTLYSNPNDGQPCSNAATITDRDGNIYNTVQLGSQCWMKENMRTTHYADNTAIPIEKNFSDIVPCRYAPNNDESFVPTCGYLYNWPAVMYGNSPSSANPSGVQGICPTGWHVPSDAEWTQLTDYLKSQSQYVCNLNGINVVGKALASTTGWGSSSSSPCAVSNIPSNNNATGFGMLPSGCSHPISYSSYFDFQSSAYYWSTTVESIGVRSRFLNYGSTDLTNRNDIRNAGYSVRCLQDEGQPPLVFLPTVITSDVSNITTTSANGGGNVISDGGTPIIARGVCWGASHNPTINGQHTTNGSGVGSFTSSIIGLANGITYLRAYATNSIGTSYGDEIIVTPNENQACLGTPNVTDIDGNTYNTVQIGNQCWMKENLRTTKYSDNTSIPEGTVPATTTAYWYYPNNNSSNKSTYGLLYNWKAVMRNSSSSSENPSGVQGICPTGWHVPSKAEWTQLKDYVSSQNQYLCDSNNSYIAKSLADTIGWQISSTSGYNNTTCDIGNTLSENNATGFSALPAGNRYYQISDYNIDYGYFNQQAFYWSSTEYGSPDFYGVIGQANYWNLRYDNPSFIERDDEKSYGYSVRCIHDEIEAQLPSVTTATISNTAATTVTCGGNVTADGGSNVIARGVCWSTWHNPIITDWHTTDGIGIGSYTSNLSGLTPGTLYYVRAYATNGKGTTYGDEMNFTTYSLQPNQESIPCPNVATVTDIDGNMYNTVQIGDQCWMRENMRTTHYPDGTEITQGTYNSSTMSYTTGLYVPTYDGDPTVLGCMYNWPSVMHGAVSSSANPSGVQGICPTGWHVPSDAEWSQLIQYVGNQSQYLCNNNSSHIAKAFASPYGWISSTTTCAVGNITSSNNIMGFSVLPLSSVQSDNCHAYYWSTSQWDALSARYRGFSYNSATILGIYNTDNMEKYHYLFVRCVKN